MKATVNVGKKSFEVEIEITDDTSVGMFRQSIIRAINIFLKKNGLKTLPKAMARTLELSSGKDKNANGRKLIKSMDMDNIVINFPSDAPKFTVPTTDDFKGTVADDEDGDDDDEDIDDVIPDTP